MSWNTVPSPQYHIVQRLLYVYTTVRFVHGAKLSFQMESRWTYFANSELKKGESLFP